MKSRMMILKETMTHSNKTWKKSIRVKRRIGGERNRMREIKARKMRTNKIRSMEMKNLR